MRSSGMLDTMQRQGVDLLRREYFPRVMSGIFAVWMLAIVSCVHLAAPRVCHHLRFHPVGAARLHARGGADLQSGRGP